MKKVASPRRYVRDKRGITLYLLVYEPGGLKKGKWEVVVTKSYQRKRPLVKVSGRKRSTPLAQGEKGEGLGGLPATGGGRKKKKGREIFCFDSYNLGGNFPDTVILEKRKR